MPRLIYREDEYLGHSVYDEVLARGFFNVTDIYMADLYDDTSELTASEIKSTAKKYMASGNKLGTTTTCNCETCSNRLRAVELEEQFYSGRKPSHTQYRRKT